MGVTLKDLLPAIGGLAAGAASPKFGQAAGQTLEMADAFGQRRRKQGMEDERMEMSRASAGRAKEAAGRAQKAEGRAERQEARTLEDFNWNQSQRILKDREQGRVDDERERAKNVGATMIAKFGEEGVEILPSHLAILQNPDSEDQLAAVGKEIRAVHSKTPMSGEAADAWHEKLIKDGKVVWAYVRRNGVLSREMLGGQKSTANPMTGVSTVLNALQGVQKSEATLEDTREDLAVESEKQTSKFLGEAEPDMTQSGPGPKTFSPEQTFVPELANQQQAVDMAELGVDQSMQDAIAQLLASPNGIAQIQNMIAQGMLPPELLEFLKQKEARGTMASEEPVDGPSATPGAAGVAYSQGF